MDRAKQEAFREADDSTSEVEYVDAVIPILIHGDAALAGQGGVAKTLNLSQIPGCHTGGTIHIVINNQIGFTTGPEEARSFTYATDIARMIQDPIFHANGDNPESCVRVARIALDYRQTVDKDVVIDMLCDRVRGHNEGDEPTFTQPLVAPAARVAKRFFLRDATFFRRLGKSHIGAVDAKNAASINRALESTQCSID